APWLDGPKLAAALNSAGLSGVRFVPVNLTPTSSMHAKQPCGGVQIIVDDWSKFNPLHTGLTVAAALRDLFPEHWDTKNYDRLLVHRASYDAFKAGKPVAEIEKGWAADVKAFRARRAPHLLYDYTDAAPFTPARLRMGHRPSAAADGAPPGGAPAGPGIRS